MGILVSSPSASVRLHGDIVTGRVQVVAERSQYKTRCGSCLTPVLIEILLFVRIAFRVGELSNDENDL